MKQVTAIAWKEWRENSALLWIALGVFLGLPIIGGVEYMLSGHWHHFEITTEPGVVGLGGIFAILVAVGSTCRDLNGKLEDFWRSRPVTGVQWMLVKFVIGLAIVVIALLVPLLAAWLIDRTNDDVRQLMFTLPAVWCLFYCIGFLAGCLLQRQAHAAVLALAALLLIYFVPVLLPSWNWVGAVMFPGQAPPPDQIAWTFAIAGSLFVVAMIAIHRYWRIEPGPRFMYGTIATAFLIFLFSTGYRLGTNLPVLQQIDLPAGQNAYTLYFQGSHGFVYTANTTNSVRYFLTIDLAADGLRLGRPLRADYLYWLHTDQIYSVRRGDVEYVASIGNATFNTVESEENFHQPLIMSLKVVDFGRRPQGGLVNSIPLPITVSAQGDQTRPLPYIWGDRFYLIGRQLVTVDISQPLLPRVISSVLLGYPEGGDNRMNSVSVSHWLDRRTIQYDLPQVPGLPEAQRLQAAIQIDGDIKNATVSDGKFLFLTQGNTIYEFSLEKLTPKLAIFKHIGQSDNELETFFTWGWPENLRLQGDLLYVPQRRNDFNPVVKVYAITGPARPRLIGHFAAESSEMYVQPLPDGRAIVAGSKIWLVGPPPHHD